MKLNVRWLAILAGCLGGVSVSNAQPAPGQSHIQMLALRRTRPQPHLEKRSTKCRLERRISSRSVK